MRNYLYFFLLLLLSACSSVDEKPVFESLPLTELASPLSRDSRVAVQVPSNGRFNEIVYKASGADTASAFKTAFEEYVQSVTLLDGCVEQECFRDASDRGSEYFVSLEIMYWEDRATNWSGKADRLTLKVSVFEVATGAELTSSFLHTNTFVYTPDGGKVEDFLPSLSKQYVSSLF